MIVRQSTYSLPTLEVFSASAIKDHSKEHLFTVENGLEMTQYLRKQNNEILISS